MKRKIQDEIYNETKDMSEEERSAYFRKSVEHGPLKELWTKAIAKQNEKRG